MPENPLLPNRKLQELYALMLRCRALDRKGDPKTRSQPKKLRFAREALLAATSMHLLPGDLLSAEPGDRTAEQLAPATKAAHGATGSLAPPQLAPRLLLCAAAARGLQTASGLQAADTGGILLAYARAGAGNPANVNNAGWAAALEWAHTAQLPLLLACLDTAPGIAVRRTSPPHLKSAASPLTWASMSSVAKRLRLPLLPVDGEDAVAVYRVMQECALRARQGGGPAVLWAIMSAPAGAARQPIPRLKTYLAARGITLA